MTFSKSMLSRLQYQHETIGELIAGLTEERLRRRINPDKWSAFENIAHLAAYQPVFISRLEKILQGPSPTFDRYVGENDPLFPAALERSLPDLLMDIQGRRAGIIDLLTGMDKTALKNTGRHPRYGLLTVTQWTEFFLLHEAHHLFTLFILVQELHSVAHR